MSILSATSCLHYLNRIHFQKQANLEFPEPSLQTLQALHQAHLLTVPFENLSIHYGQPIILREEALYHKIVRQRRGGFCYELNGLFAWLLQQLGFQVTLLSAGVSRADGSFGPEFDHLTLLIHQLNGANWLADVGFGASFQTPLRFAATVEQEGADGHTYRLLQEHAERTENIQRTYWILQQWNDNNVWEAQYRFTLQPHKLVDFIERCHYQQTSPDSHFTQKRICSLASQMGRITLSDLHLITTLQGEREEQILESEEEYLRILAAKFDIVL